MNEKEAYEMGEKAYKDGLPSVPMLNKAFWDLNKDNGGKSWLDNLMAYSRGWFSYEKEIKK